MRLASLTFAIFCIVQAVGCGSKVPSLGQIKGTLTQGATPLGQVHIQFMPDPEKGNMALASSGISDAAGAFSLKYSNTEEQGAAVGWVRVVLTDEKTMEDRENPQPPRFDSKFMSANSTPIRFEVKSGENKIDIDLSKY